MAIIPCSDINQTISYLRNQFIQCKPIKADDLQMLLDLLVALQTCSEGGGGVGIFPDHNDLQGLNVGDYQHLSILAFNYLNEIYENDLIGDLTTDVDQLQAAINLLATPFNYVAPTSSISNVTGVYEVGSTVSIDINQTFTQNNAGNLISQTITKNGTTVSNTNSFTETLPIILGNTTYSGNVTYAQGDCLPNNIGIIDCTNRIAAGTISSAPRVVTGALRRYNGSVNTIPSTGTEIRNSLLGSSVINTGNNFSFTTGTINRRFIIAIPNSKTLVSVQNTGTNEFLTFNLSNSITSIPDASGTNQPYKVYILENSVPFSSNYTLNVILN